MSFTAASCAKRASTTCTDVVYMVSNNPVAIPLLSRILFVWCRLARTVVFAGETEHGIVVGGAVTLATLQDKLNTLCNTLPAQKCRVFTAVLANLEYFAGDQIRNVSSLAGNIVNASPISDLR